MSIPCLPSFRIYIIVGWSSFSSLMSGGRRSFKCCLLPSATPAIRHLQRRKENVNSTASTQCLASQTTPPPISQPAAFLQMMTSKVWKAHFYHKYAYSISTYTILYYTKPTPCHPERLLIYWLTFGFKCPPCIETRYKSVPFIWNLSLAWSCHCSHRHQNAKPLLTFQHYNWGLLPHCVWGGNS